VRKDILLFAAGAVLTALAVKYATAALLWDLIFWAGIIAMVFSAADMALRNLAVSARWRNLTHGFLGAVLLGTILFFSLPHDESLPGFGSYAYLRLYDTPDLRRKVIYDFKTPQGGGIKFFLSSSGQFNFTVTDVNKETYSVELPITAIPLDRFIFLFCDVGVSENKTNLRVIVDDKQVGFRSLPFRIDLGDVSKIGKGAIGADTNGQNNSPFSIEEVAVYSQTPTYDQRLKLMDNFKTYLNATK
jgi:hypothetical protein